MILKHKTKIQMENGEKKDLLIEIQRQAKQMIGVVDGLAALAMAHCTALGAEAVCFSSIEAERSIRSLAEIAGNMEADIQKKSDILYEDLGECISINTVK